MLCLGEGLPFFVDGAVGAGRADSVCADPAVVLSEPPELDEADLALFLLPVFLLILQT